MPQKLNKNLTKSRLHLVKWGERFVGVWENLREVQNFRKISERFGRGEGEVLAKKGCK